MNQCAKCGHDIKRPPVRVVQGRRYHPSCYEYTRKQRATAELDLWHAFMRLCCESS